jgi:hypothetical protein
MASMESIAYWRDVTAHRTTAPQQQQNEDDDGEVDLATLFHIDKNTVV